MTARIDALAGQLVRPVPQLSRFIKQYTGKIFTEILQHKRLNQAVFLRTNSQLSVEDIVAEAVNYDYQTVASLGGHSLEVMLINYDQSLEKEKKELMMQIQDDFYSCRLSE